MVASWNEEGIIPPVAPGASGESRDRAPYRVTMEHVVRRFSTSSVRRRILRGLLDLRARLREAGLDEGFQWLDGSFLEDVESLEGRSPRDVDVVTFAPLGDAAAQRALALRHPHTFDGDWVFANLFVDHYWVNLSQRLDEDSVADVTYWYSMWAHRRDHRWKGFLQVDLIEDDRPALLALDVLAGNEEGLGTEP